MLTLTRMTATKQVVARSKVRAETRLLAATILLLPCRRVSTHALTFCKGALDCSNSSGSSSSHNNTRAPGSVAICSPIFKFHMLLSLLIYVFIFTHTYSCFATTTVDISAPASRPLDYSTESAPAPSPPIDANDLPTSSPAPVKAPTGDVTEEGSQNPDVPPSSSTDPPASQPTTGGGQNPDGSPSSSTDPPASQPTAGGGDGGVGESGGGDDENNDACKTDKGEYGALDGAALVVPFLYTVELSEDLPYAEYVTTVVPALEVDMNDYVVPFLFENCADNADVAVKQQAGNHVRRRRLAVTILGMTSKPFDSYTDQVVCEVEHCYGMLGQVTLYLQQTTTDENNNGRRALQQQQDDDDIKTVAEQLRTALQQGMDDGQFDNNPPIARVSFIDGSWDEGDGSGNGGDGGTSLEDGDKSINASDGGPDARLVAPLVVAGGLAILVIAAIVVRRRRPRPNNAENASLVAGSAATPTPSDTVALSENVKLQPARTGSDVRSVT